MAELCFQCDVELVPAARFCHGCGAPTFAVGETRTQGAPATAEARAEIKEVVRSAAQHPTATKMVQTVLVPTLPRPRAQPARPPLWFRILAARIWRRPLAWVAIVALAAVPTVLAIVDDLQDKAQQQAGVQKIVTRLSARCFRDSRAQIEAFVARIQAASAGSDSLLDSAALLDLIVRGMRLPQGDCGHIVEALSRPDRFEQLFRQPASR
jgi:hypothetical protein